MERKSFADAHCSIARSLDVLGDWWNPLILRECHYGVHRFDGFLQWLGIGRNILTRRLKLLVEQGLLVKRPYQDNPPRFEYHLTPKGYDALIVLIALMPFGEKWSFERGKEPIRLYDRKTGRRVRPVVVDRDTGKPLDPREIYTGPGPSFPRSARVRRARFREYYERNAEE